MTGYGIIDVAGSRLLPVTYGHVRTSSATGLPERLLKIHEAITSLLAEFRPDDVAVENIFYADNVKTAIVMGHARGAILVAAKTAGADVYEYSPREVKMSVVGNGAASKSQVKFMVARLLSIKETITPDDASDALAVALCRWHRQKLNLRG